MRTPYQQLEDYRFGAQRGVQTAIDLLALDDILDIIHRARAVISSGADIRIHEGEALAGLREALQHAGVPKL